MSTERSFLNALYPLHTGQAGHWVGRVLIVSVGGASIVLMFWGVRLWWTGSSVKSEAAR